MKSRTFYYYDEQKDDFANNHIDGRAIGGSYRYLPNNLLYRLLKPIVYYTVHFLCVILLRFLMLVPLKNTQVLRDRQDSAKGYFIYSNHTSRLMDAISAPVTAFPQQCYTITSPDAVSIPGIRLLVRLLGALPVPTSLGAYRAFNAAIDELYESGNVIAIFPEAHIWPKYNGIREFSAVSFQYPVRLQAPCFVKTTVYRKIPGGRTYPELVYDGPFYPDPSLTPAQAREDLRRRVYEQMKSRVEEYGSAADKRYHYVHADSAEEVRTEEE